MTRTAYGLSKTTGVIERIPRQAFISEKYFAPKVVPTARSTMTVSTIHTSSGMDVKGMVVSGSVKVTGATESEIPRTEHR